MGWEDEELTPVDFAAASLLSAFFPGLTEKPWGDLVGQPATGKTEIVRMFEDGDRRCQSVGTLTENSLISGYRDKEKPDEDPSLLAKLIFETKPRGPKMLVIREFSTVMALRQEPREKIIAQLREAYDGKASAWSGLIGDNSKRGLQFGLLTASTEGTDEVRRASQTLGARTLVCRMGRELRTIKNTLKVARNVRNRDAIQAEALREHIQRVTWAAFDRAYDLICKTKGRVTATNEQYSKLELLGMVASRVRTVPLSRTSYASTPESPARIQQQLKLLGDSRAIFDGRTEWNDDDFALIIRIAQDTMPPENLDMIRALYRGSPERAVRAMSPDEVAEHCTTEHSVLRQLIQWSPIEVTVKHRNNMFSLHPDFAEAIALSGFLESQNGQR